MQVRVADPGRPWVFAVVEGDHGGVAECGAPLHCGHVCTQHAEFQRVDANDRPIEDPVLAILEVICIICFSAEYTVRLVVAPSPRKFLEKPLNIIDFVSILPFYLTLAFETIDEEGSEEESENLENVGKVVQVLRLMRIFRILKLARHSVRLRALGATMRHSYEEVGLLILFLSVGISIFSVLIYSAEKENADSDLSTIPVGWCWATITMTTVGYGDTCPVTTAGKVVATLCIICGLLVVALPISIIFNKFSKVLPEEQGLGRQPVCGSREASGQPLHAHPRAVCSEPVPVPRWDLLQKQ